MKENRELTQPDEEYSLTERVPLACNNQHDCNLSLVFLWKMANISHLFLPLFCDFTQRKALRDF